jgi:hypothetical protein
MGLYHRSDMVSGSSILFNARNRDKSSQEASSRANYLNSKASERCKQLCRWIDGVRPKEFCFSKVKTIVRVGKAVNNFKKDFGGSNCREIISVGLGGHIKALDGSTESGVHGNGIKDGS